MAIHAPAHPSGAVTPQVHHHYLAWLVVSAAVVLAIGAALLAPPGILPFGQSATGEQRSLVEFRAAERADWAMGIVGAERDSLIQFRAGERPSD